MPAFSHFQLLEASAKPGCPICRLVQSALEHYLDSMFYESVNDPAIRARLRRSHGFCNRHAWQVLEHGLGDALGIAIIYHDVIENVLRELPVAPGTGRSGDGGWLGWVPRRAGDLLKAAVKALTPQEPCPACLQEASTTALALTELADSLAQAEMVAALAASDGLCLPHLRQAMDFLHDEKSAGVMLTTHREKLESLHFELSEFIRKNDYRFQKEAMGSERDAGRRAIATTAGQRSSKE